MTQPLSRRSPRGKNVTTTCTNGKRNLRDQVIRHRKEVYRRFVAGLLRTHGRVFLEDLQIRAMARKDQPEEETRNYSGSMRVVAAVSVLGRMFQEHGDCVRVSAQHTTRQCSWCGHEKEWDAAENIMHRCGGCGSLFDQDRNAARNILRRGLLDGSVCCGCARGGDGRRVNDFAEPSSGVAVTERAES